MIRRRPIVVGLTGSIGMGKSTVAKMFARLGLRVLSADQIVHDLLAKGGEAVSKVARRFPSALVDGAIDRSRLAALITQQPEQLHVLEKIIHPFVWRTQRAFIQKAQQDGVQGVLIEIPLLFETGAEKRVDVVVCVHATAATQKKRVLARRGMTMARLRTLLSRQIPAREKKARADYVVSTECALMETRRQVKLVWKDVLEKHA